MTRNRNAKMKTAKTVLASSVALVLFGFVAVEPATAQLLNDGTPTCFKTTPFSDILVWFLNSNGGTQLDGSGRDLSGNRSQTVDGFVISGVLHVGYTTYPKPGFVPVVVGGSINLASGSGPGQCFAPTLASCGSFTFTKIACPLGAAALGVESDSKSQGAK
jgi:hypothetical protein